MRHLLESLFSETLDYSKKFELFHALLEGSNDMIFIIRIDNGEVEYVNQAVSEISGYSFDEIKALGIEKIRRPLKEEISFLHYLQELKQQGKLTDYAMLLCKDGTELPVEARVRMVKYEEKDYNIAIVRDISESVDAEQKLEALNKNLESIIRDKTLELHKNIATLEGYKVALDAGNIVSKSDSSGRITYVNESFCKVSGYTPEEALGKSHNIVRHPDTDNSVFKELWETISSKKMWRGIIKNKKKDGGSYWIDINIVPILDESGEVLEFIAVRHDITEIIEKRKILEQMIITDTLTALGNRHKLIEDIKIIQNPSLALFNIDNFREINDFYGHQFGDFLINEVAKAI